MIIEAYHGTKNLKSVLRNGIRVGHNALEDYPERSTFLTTDLYEAKKYALAPWSRLGSMHGQRQTGGVVRVRLPSSFGFAVELEGTREPYGYLDALILPDFPTKGEKWYVVEHRIPPECITEVYVVDNYNWRKIK